MGDLRLKSWWSSNRLRVDIRVKYSLKNFHLDEKQVFFSMSLRAQRAKQPLSMD